MNNKKIAYTVEKHYSMQGTELSGAKTAPFTVGELQIKGWEWLDYPEVRGCHRRASATHLPAVFVLS